MTTQTTMSRPSPLRRLAIFSQRHHWTALLLWVVVLVGVTAAAQGIGDDYRNSFDIPGTQSQEMADLQAKHGESTGDEVRAVIHDERGWNTDQQAVDELLADLAEVPHVESVEPADPQRGSVSDDGTTALVTIVMDAEAGELPTSAYEPFLEIANETSTDDLQVEMAGDSMREVNEGEGGSSEGIGMLAALVIMLFMFGSFLAASLPLITAIFAVGTTFGVVTLLSHVTTIPDYTAPMLMLVGLGVGIDYALLVFSRYRSELLGGATREDATSTAIDTAGRSVLFAGVSVILALCGLYVLQLTSIQGVVLGVALTVLMTMLAAVTLLPSLLTLFGKRLEKSVRRHAARSRREPGRRWRAWADGVQRHPWAALIVSLVALGALAFPVFSLQLGFADAGNDDTSSTTRKAYDLVSDKFGPGANGPLVIMTEGSQEQAGAAYEELQTYAGVAAVTPPRPSADGAVFTSIAFPETGPQDPETTELVKDLRKDLGGDVLVGGSTAALIDYSDAVAKKLPLFIGLVVGLSALLLMCVFRSVAVAIKAAILNLISIGASMGAMTYVFQEGLLGVEPGPIEAFLPVMTFAIVFGLSMDYEVFLISRMREEWLRSGDAQEAVREGLAHTGGVITAAGAIMVVVFGAFWFSPDRMLQEMGFVMAVAVLLDAVVVRCLVVPAVMRLLGTRAWWLPRWLDRILPRLQHVD
ncbi:MMPL family transporter [Nocardioides albus]|uniref:RND superfamily putative drug exporter n=1 Tax=Nocardioides albus TaxID=1841 RepID=A0A7W5A228_9ACTN|nr:MMPL family transporter [Nocardioides albus]MBB3088080.1 RND superfamily putative drug exporter [Nocardioides albus]GGU22436.1 membrane protein [Nocardioides albus]